jgi:hypothetical protein
VRRPAQRESPPESTMNRYVAHLGFALAAAWIVVVVILVSAGA